MGGVLLGLVVIEQYQDGEKHLLTLMTCCIIVHKMFCGWMHNFFNWKVWTATKPLIKDKRNHTMLQSYELVDKNHLTGTNLVFIGSNLANLIDYTTIRDTLQFIPS